METSDYVILSVFTIGMGLGLFGSYSLGKHHERRDLTKALIEQTEGIYYDGYGDAEKACRAGGIK